MEQGNRRRTTLEDKVALQYGKPFLASVRISNALVKFFDVGENACRELRVDVFVCIIDPAIEPPIMVINTELSVITYNYPTEKLSVYLLDDVGSELTFYALLEAFHFTKHWLPYCKKFNIELRSPAAYFASLSVSDQSDPDFSKIKSQIKQNYDTLNFLNRIHIYPRKAMLLSSRYKQKYQKLLIRILIDSRDEEMKDIDGVRLPTFVYAAQEKHPQHLHNFKAGAMNALASLSTSCLSHK
ncbi:hypothetical protein T459_02601 [Capsicum annuum]|uniref:Uncharacterized protein n=1 Tax=Capsicum annuum TaxID=4072 RepID=A0A2G3AKG3_CAPAN|nr:hypothetical protein T459_02601 [Capsicum annuum]